MNMEHMFCGMTDAEVEEMMHDLDRELWIDESVGMGDLEDYNESLDYAPVFGLEGGN